MSYRSEILSNDDNRHSSQNSSLNSEHSIPMLDIFEKYYFFKMTYIFNSILWIASLIITATLSLYFYSQLQNLNSQIHVLKNQVLILTSKQEFFEKSLKTSMQNGTYYDVDIENENNDALCMDDAEDESDYDENRLFDPESNDTEVIQPSYRKSRPKKVNRKLDITAIHFKGAIPQITIFNDGKVGPWKYDDLVTRKATLRQYRMEDRNTTIRVNSAGLYLIYAQVKYESRSIFNSFSIHLLTREHNDEPVTLSECNTYGGQYFNVPVDVNCYTSFVRYLKQNDAVYVHQNLRNSTLILTTGHSFFGLVQLYKAPN